MNLKTTVARTGSGFFGGLAFGFLLIGCVSASFSYKWYYLEPVSFDGKLLGSSPDKDLDLSVCKNDAQGNHTCVVMLKSEFQSLYLDYLDIQNKLKSCEQPQ